MIAVFSTKEIEDTTVRVMEWIRRLGGTCVRINGEDFPSLDFGLDPKGADGRSFLVKNGKKIRLSGIRSVWFRRWGRMPQPDVSQVRDSRLRTVMDRHMWTELRGASACLYHALSHARWFSTPDNVRPDKLGVLKTAAALGFSIPKTLVTSDKATLLDFRKRHGDIVVKCITDADLFPGKNGPFTLYTNTFSLEHIAALADLHFPVLVQKKIDKAYEIRTFYLEGTCHSMAIFSQDNRQTREDFRRYDFRNPNRTVPYRLGKSLETKVTALMARLSMDTGSLDFMRGQDGDTYFLEFNPVGQFGMVSYPCNMNLEKKVAEFLIAGDRESSFSNQVSGIGFQE